MNEEQRLEMLKEQIQNAISEYVYETGDENFSASVEISASCGWSEMPEIKKYVHFEE